jgi:hypothetical protein
MQEDLTSIFLNEYQARPTLEPTEVSAGLAMRGMPAPTQEKPKGILGDIGTGLAEMPGQIVGGVADAYNNSIGSLIDSAWDWAGENFESLHEMHEAHPDFAIMPTTDAAESTTGSLIRSTSQFLTGFIPALKGAKILGLGRVVGSMAAGAAADFSVYDGLDSRVSDLIQSVPALANPVSEYLASDPTDSQAEGRFKNVLEGMGMGLLTEGVTTAFKALKGIKSKAAVDMAEDAPGMRPTPTADPMDKFSVEAKQKPEVKPVLKPRADLEQIGVDAIKKGKVRLEDVIEDFNFEKIQTNEDALNVIKITSEVYQKMFKEAKGGLDDGVEHLAETKMVAELIGENPETLMKTLNHLFKGGKFGGTDNLAGKVMAIKKLMVQSAEETARLRDLVLNPETDTVVNQLMLKRQVIRHVGIEGQFKSVQTNIARGLNVMKQVTDSNGRLNISPEELQLILDAQGGSKTIRAFAERLKRFADDPAGAAKANKFMRQAHSATKIDKIHYYWINSILSGPQTQVVNITSNMAALGMDVIEHGIAGVRNMITGKGEVTIAEAAGRVKAMALSVLDAFKAAGRAYKADGSLLDPHFGKVDTIKTDITGSFGFGDGSASGLAKVLGATVSAVKPLRFMQMADEFFKSLAIRGEVYSQLFREARAKGLHDAGRKQELKAFIKEWMDNPPDYIQDAAIKQARILTFQEELGKTGQELTRFIQKVPTLKFLMPFVKTPINIMKYVGRRTPVLYQMTNAYKEAISQGGAVAELAKARIATGSMLYMGGLTLAANGLIVGGADSSRHRGDGLINRQQYAFKMGDTYINFSRNDPFGMFFGMCADIIELGPYLDPGELDELAAVALVAGTKNLMSKTYLTGLTDALTALNEPDRKMVHWMQNFVGSFIPNFMNQINRSEFDKEIKETHGFVDAIYKRTFGTSKYVFPKRHPITGEPIHYGDSGRGSLLPTYMSEETQDPGLQEMVRLGMSTTQPPKAFRVGRGTEVVDLKPEEYDHYQQAITAIRNRDGRTLVEQIGALVNSPGYNKIDDDEEKRSYIQGAINAFRKEGKKAFLSQNPRVVNELKRRKGAQINKL